MDSSVIHQKVKDYVTKKNINEIEAKKEIKKEMEESLLARKHNLRSEFDKFILNTMEHYYINSNEEEEE
jgi:hypothetical protein